MTLNDFVIQILADRMARSNPPISKKYRVYKAEKLLSEFEIDLSSRTKDKRIATCKNCIEQRKKEEEERLCGRCRDCINNKFLAGIHFQLSCLLSMLENHDICVPIDIIEMFHAIEKQDAANHGGG